MDRALISIVLLGIVLSCNKSPDNQDLMLQEAAANKQSFMNVKLDTNVDLVCKMSLSFGIADTAHFQSKILGFCSKDCKNKFIKNPGSY